MHGSEQEETATKKIAGMLSCFEKGKEELEQSTVQPQAMVSTGMGLAALPRKLVEKIKANEYIDFTDLPLAKGKARPIPQSLEGQVLVVQAADLLQVRKIIPDLATWLQCLTLYVATLAPSQPSRVPEMMAYQTIIAKASQKYIWPSWVVYDQNFRQEAANNPDQSWTKVEPSIYAQCFTGQAINTANWCIHCQCLDHTANSCPLRPRKRTWSSAFPQLHQEKSDKPVCIKYNKFNGDCRFGKECRFRHVCSACGDPHPASKCKAEGSSKPQ